MEYKVGDRVIVRQWNAMENEFDLDVTGNINCKSQFIVDMKYLCGKVAKIKAIGGFLIQLEFEEKLKPESWSYSTDMILPYIQKEDIVKIPDDSPHPPYPEALRGTLQSVRSVDYTRERVTLDMLGYLYNIKDVEIARSLVKPKLPPVAPKTFKDEDLKEFLKELHPSGSRVIAPSIVKDTTDHDYFKIGAFTPAEKTLLLSLGFKPKTGSMAERLPGNCYSNLKYDIWDTEVAYGQAYLRAQIELMTEPESLRNDKKRRCAFLDERTYMFGEPEGHAFKMGGFYYCRDIITGELHRWPTIGKSKQGQDLINKGTKHEVPFEGSYETPYNNTIQEEHEYKVTAYN